MYQSNVKYEVRELEQRKRSKDELIESGVVIMDDLSKIKESALLLGVEIDDNDELLNTGMTITHLGTISNPKWALHDLDLEPEYIKNLYEGTNLYDLYLILEDQEPILAMKSIYVSEDSFEADVEHYIELDMNFRTHQYDNSGYIH